MDTTKDTDYEFDSILWRPENGSWIFATLPHDVSALIADGAGDQGPGFGSVKVEVTIGSSSWRTSVFPSKELQAYILPVKKAVRSAEHLDEGSATKVQLTLV